MLCLPSVDALRELRLKGISPYVVSPSVNALRELRPKGISPDVVSPKCRCSKRASSQGN